MCELDDLKSFPFADLSLLSLIGLLDSQLKGQI